MESDRYKLTVLFLKTFFRSWALSVKLSTHTNRHGVSSLELQGHLMTHTSNLCVQAPPADGPANYLLVQTPCRETNSGEAGGGENNACAFVCEWIIWNCMLTTSHVKTNEHVHMNGFVRPPPCIYAVCISTFSPCLFLYGNVCVCLQPAGSGTVARQGDHFQPAGDLTLICSMLMTAAGLRPQRAQQTWLN